VWMEMSTALVRPPSTWPPPSVYNAWDIKTTGGGEKSEASSSFI